MSIVPVRCSECGSITTAESLDDDSISLVGVTGCPGCGNQTFTELEAAGSMDDEVLRAA